MNTNFVVSGKHLDVRRAETKDESFLYQVYASTRMDEMALVSWTAEQKAAFLKMQFEAQRKHYAAYYSEPIYFVIQREGVDAGRLIVDRSGDPILLIDIALLPEFRNIGIATLLIQDLIAEASQRGRSIRLHVESFNPARKLYERLGFVKKREQGIYWEMIWANPILNLKVDGKGFR